MKRVLIIQAQMKRYRVPLFEKLNAALAEDGIDLRVAYSDPLLQELDKNDNAELSAHYGVKVSGTWFFGERMLYQGVGREIALADLVIVEQANKHVWNHLLLLLSAFRRKRLAFWGLGENKQANRSEVSEWYKRKTLSRVNWWFAYTQGTARFLAENGADPERITSVNNAVDTGELRRLCSGFSCEELEVARRHLGIAPGDSVGVYCGMLDRVKGLDFLIASARKIRSCLVNFHLILVGGGPERVAVELQARGETWIHSVGPQFGREKALLLKLSDVLLNPGRVGLVILDAFAAGLPLLTTELAIHGPEIEYLEDGRNGLITPHVEEQYTAAIVRVLTEPELLARLRSGARESGEKYSIEVMVRRFRDGILQCLSRGKKASHERAECHTSNSRPVQEPVQR
jgi:glycosyltransferase involved in cell wall biosynthesis